MYRKNCFDDGSDIKVPDLRNYYCNKYLDKKQYQQLWSLLSYTGPLDNRGGGPITDIPVPDNPSSNLIGLSFITDPTSVVKVVLFDNPGPGEPIISGGFFLETFNNLSGYEISWTLNDKNASKKRKHSKVKIGFYTSDSFEFDTTNKLVLICGNKGPSIFDSTTESGNRGSFKCDFINRIYVAVDKEVEVNLKVTAIIPSVLSFPDITRENYYYIEYFKIFDGCNLEKIPIYKIRAIDASTFDLLKTASKKFRTVASVIQNFLEDTSLSITLFSNPNQLADIPFQIYGPDQIIPYTFGSFNIYRNLSMNTTLIASYGTYRWRDRPLIPDFFNQGIKTITNHVKITYIITLSIEGSSSAEHEDVTATTKLLQLNGGLWYTYDTDDNKKAESSVGGIIVNSSIPTVLTGSFTLTTAGAFNITVYFSAGEESIFLVNPEFTMIRIDYL